VKNIDLIVSDLDGTLLMDGEIANDNDRDMIRCLQAQDYKIVLATGRTWYAASVAAKELYIDRYVDLVICNNGAIVSKASKYEPIMVKKIATNVIQELFTLMIANDICMYAFVADKDAAYWNGVPCPSVNLNKIDWANSFENLPYQGASDDVDIVQVMILTPFEKEKQFLEITKEYRAMLPCIKNDHEDMPFYEFNAENVSKGSAIEFIADHLKVDLKKTIAFGDNYNDISMFDVVGTSIAMDNASDTVKHKATTTTLSVTDGGVSYYLNQMIMNLEE
jgi:Cof subfamily protein (haloacid dehalogenase superfamily)